MSKSRSKQQPGRAIPFIVPDDEGTFELTDEAVAFLRGIDLPVAPVAVAGRYRTGKSFLMNCLVQQSTAPAANGFEVGPTIEACTRGIWLWSEPVIVTSASGQKTAVLFVDTEGLGANTSDVQHDARVFALATLLCSVLIYNSVGTIDEEAISQLSFVAQLSRHIEAKEGRHDGSHGSSNDDDEDEYGRDSDVDSDVSDAPRAGGRGKGSGGGGVAGHRPTPRPDAFSRGGLDHSGKDSFFPTFLWVVRDFSLELIDPEDGSILSPKEYLETCLASQPGYASDVLARNRVRRALTSYFKRRDCCTLVRPVDEEEELSRLDTMPWNSLRREFRTGMDGLRSKVLSELAQPKTADGTPVTGRVLAGLAEAFVSAINSGGVPSIAGAWEASTKGECEAALTAARAVLDGGLAADAHAGLMPLDEPELKHIHDTVLQNALAAYDARAVGPTAPVLRQQLVGRGEESWARLRADNAAASEATCARLARQLWEVHVDITFQRPSAASVSPSAGFDPDAVSSGVAAFRAAYLNQARGPAVHKALSLSLLDNLSMLIRAVASAKGAQAEAAGAVLESQLAHLRESCETAAARAAVYEQQCADLRKEKTSGVVDKSRAEAEAKAAKEEMQRLLERLGEVETSKEEVERKLAQERKEHAATRLQLRAASAGVALHGGSGDGSGSAASAIVAAAGVTGGHGRGSGSAASTSGSGTVAGRPASGTASAAAALEYGEDTVIDADADRKYKLRMMPAGAEHIAAPIGLGGHRGGRGSSLGGAGVHGQGGKGSLSSVAAGGQNGRKMEEIGSTADFPQPPPRWLWAWLQRHVALYRPVTGALARACHAAWM